MTYRRTSIRIVIAAALAAPTFAAPPTTETATDWAAQLHSALVATGNAEAVAYDLARRADQTPDVLRSRVRASLEAGDLTAAADLLQKAAGQSPADVTVLRELAYVQELLDRPDAAEQTLNKALDGAVGPVSRSKLMMRLATLAFDGGRPAEAAAWLDRALATDPTRAVAVGMLADLFGEYPVAVRSFAASGDADPSIRLVMGNAALKAGQTEIAAQTFAAAGHAARRGDRLYARERLIATARQAGTLSNLADAWLAEKRPSAEQLLPLAAVLRELNRVPELLAWWRSALNDPALADAVLADRFVTEVLGAAESAGRSEDALSVCRALLERQPDSPQWLAATLRELLTLGRTGEADALLRARLAAAGDVPQAIDQVARTAKTLGRDAVALEAAGQLTALGGTHAVAGRLLEFSIDQAAGRSDQADLALSQAAEAAAAHPTAVVPVVNALETAGHNAQAIRLLQQSTIKDQSDEALSRLASLLIKVDRYDEAIAVLERLRHTASGPAVRFQAAQQLLKSVVAIKGTAGLAERLRTQIDSGHGDAQDLSLLVDALLRQHRLDAAAAAIRQSKLLDDAGKLRMLAVLYLRQKDAPNAVAVLKQLVTIDPQNAGETLERLAAVAAGLGRTDDATAAVEQIRQRAGTTPLSLSMMAGVLDRLGRHGEAAVYYRRVLADAPQDGDDWLLWATAMSKAGQAAAATRRLQVVCDEADTDSTFAFAVDGLLNLNAPPGALRVARRDALLRLAERPEQMLLYHVLSDLSDELGDTQANIRVTEASVSVSAEERPQRLRELIDLASQRSMTDTAVDCGRTLLALGDEFPPQLFLQIGEQLLIGGRTPDALRALSRAGEVSDADTVAPRAAELLIRYGDVTEALKLLRPLADRHRDDTAFNTQLTGLNEASGNAPAAYAGYLALMEQSCRAMATDSTAPTEIAMSMGMSGAPARRIAASPMQETLAQQAVGALAMAGTPQEERAVLDLLENKVRRMMADDVREPSVGLVAMLAVLRDVAFTLGAAEVADRVDAAMITRWPGNAGLKTRAVQSRTLHGRAAEAYEFAVAHGVPIDPWLGRYARVFRPGPATLPEAVTPEWAAEALPPLTVHGADGQAEAILAALARDTAGPATAPATPAHGSDAEVGLPVWPYHNLVLSAAALGDDTAATHWALAWADALPDPEPKPPATRPGGPAAQLGGGLNQAAWTYQVRFSDLIMSVWPALSVQGRAALVDRVAESVGRIREPMVGAQLSTTLLRMASDADRPLPDAVAVAVRVTCDAAANVSAFDGRVADVFGPLPVSARPQFLQAAFAGLPAHRRLALLTAVVAQANGPLDDATAAIVTALTRQVPTGQVLGWNDWMFNVWQPAVLRALTDAVRRAAVDAQDRVRAADQTALAVAMANLGDRHQADRDAADATAAIETMAGEGDAAVQAFEPDRAVLFRLAVSAMTPQARAAETNRIKAADAAGGASAWSRIRAATLLEADGDRSGALAALRDGLGVAPNDPLLIRLYLTRLQDDGRLAELATLRSKMAASDAMAGLLREPLVRALRGLYRLREMQAAVEDPGPMVPNFMTPAAAHDASGLETAMRRTLQDARAAHVPPAPAVTPDAGGLPSATRSRQATALPPLFSDLVRRPIVLGQALKTAHLAAFDGTDLFDTTPRWLAAVIGQAATDTATRERVLSDLAASADRGSLSRAERLLIAGIATIPGAQVPPALLERLWPAALTDDSGKELLALGDALVSQHVAGAPRVRKFARLALQANGIDRQAGAEADEVSPQGRPDDAAMARALSTRAQTEPADAERRLAHWLDTGRLTPRATACRLLFARLAAERGDTAVFKARVAATLRDYAWQQAAPVPGTMADAQSDPPDIRLCLPAMVSDASQRAAITEALSESLAAAASQWPGCTDLTRMTAALGAWAATQGDSAAGEVLLQQAESAATRQGTGEHQLWVADLAGRLGHTAVLTAIEQAELTDRCLPAVRIAPLLERLQAAGQTDVARHLSLDAALYCNVPGLNHDTP